MAVNKVEFSGQTLLDLTEDTVTAENLLAGCTAHNAAGQAITGAISNKTASNITVSGKTVTVPEGFYENTVTKDVSDGSVTVATPTVNSSGLVTASATVSAGYVSSTPTSKTLQLPTQTAKIVTPGDISQTAVASGVYTTGVVTVAAVPSDTYIKRSEVVTYHVVSSTPTAIYNDGDLILKVVS